MKARLLRGTELRYVLTMNLRLHGKSTIPDLIETLEYQGFGIPGHASKIVSDALRGEMRKDRVRRLRWGLYGPGQMPRSTEHYINNRYLDLRDEASELRAEENNVFWDAVFGPRD